MHCTYQSLIPTDAIRWTWRQERIGISIFFSPWKRSNNMDFSSFGPLWIQKHYQIDIVLKFYFISLLPFSILLTQIYAVYWQSYSFYSIWEGRNGNLDPCVPAVESCHGLAWPWISYTVSLDLDQHKRRREVDITVRLQWVSYTKDYQIRDSSFLLHYCFYASAQSNPHSSSIKSSFFFFSLFFFVASDRVHKTWNLFSACKCVDKMSIFFALIPCLVQWTDGSKKKREKDEKISIQIKKNDSYSRRYKHAVLVSPLAWHIKWSWWNDIATLTYSHRRR